MINTYINILLLILFKTKQLLIIVILMTYVLYVYILFYFIIIFDIAPPYLIVLTVLSKLKFSEACKTACLCLCNNSLPLRWYLRSWKEDEKLKAQRKSQRYKNIIQIWANIKKLSQILSFFYFKIKPIF